LRLAEDYAVADILTKGRTVFGVGRGYHTREVETFGAPLLDQAANRELFEEQVEILFKAFHSERFSHKGRHYTLPPDVAYRGRPLKEITLVPRPVNRPVECWQPIVSATPRALDLMVKHGIKGAVGGGAATMAEGPIAAYRDAAARAGKLWELGQNLTVGIFFHLARTREQAIREMTPFYEEHVKMFAPLGFVPGITPAQVSASQRRGGWAEAGVPTLEHFMKTGAWFAGTPDDLVEHLKRLEARFPGMEHINLSTSLCTPKSVMLEQFQWVAEAVMPSFRGAPAAGAASAGAGVEI
jgi:alkanesulfonate monooxygenase SsuD/methylene tetrahydromethanopterin reductase-like flavin-dependent oxidoreductase (luciferase family)